MERKIIKCGFCMARGKDVDMVMSGDILRQGKRVDMYYCKECDGCYFER